MKKRITAIITALLILCNGSVFAKKLTDEEIEQNYLNDTVDMERVFEYDYNVAGDDTDDTEVLKHSDAVNIVRALGLMKNLENGTFNEDDAVSYKDFAEIIMTLAVGGKMDGAYDQYSSKYASMGDASYYLTGALGYNVYDVENPGDQYRETKARNIGLFKGIEFNPAKNITRGELAQMIYNALDIDIVIQTSYGENEQYDIAKDRTLMTEVFDGLIIKGVVTAQNGMNMYTEANGRDDEIEIDRVSYRLGDNEPEDIFGHYVVAAALRDKSDVYTLAGVFVSENDPTIEIDTDKITNLKKGTLYYEDGDEELDVDVSMLERVVYNGEIKKVSDFDLDLLSGSGTLRLCVSERKGDYVTAVIRAYSTYIVGAYSQASERIILSNRMTYKGQGHIDVSKNKNITVYIDGVKSDLSAVTAGMAISVLENPSGKSVDLRLSSVQLKGEITEIDDGDVTINGKVYKLSDAYDKVLENDSEAVDVAAGREGTFLLDFKNKIVKFSHERDTEYGYLMDFASGKGVDGDISLKVFTERNEFEYLPLADKLVLDGKSSVSKENAYSTMNENKSQINKALIRFKLDDNGKIKFLDTLMRDSGGNTNESISFDATFSGTMDWTAGSKNYTNLGDTMYKFKPYTKSFEIPTDETVEGDFIFRSAPAYVSGDNVDFELYNVNDFGIAGAVLERVNGADSSALSRGDSYLVVLDVSLSLDEQGNEYYSLEGFDGTTPPNWVAAKFKIYETLNDKAKALKKGDIIKFSATGTEIRNLMRIVSIDDIYNDYFGEHGSQEWLGTVDRISVESDIAIVNIKSEVRGFVPHSVGLYDTKKQKAYQISFSDIEPGDRIFCYGGCSLMRMLIIR